MTNTVVNSIGGNVDPNNTLNVTGDSVFNYITQNIIHSDNYDEIDRMTQGNFNLLNDLSGKLQYLNERTAAAMAIANIPYLTENHRMTIGFGAGFTGKANTYGMAFTGTGKRLSYKAGAFVSGRGRVTGNVTAGLILGR